MNDTFGSLQRCRKKCAHLLFPLVLLIAISFLAWIGKGSNIKLDWSDTKVSVTDTDGNVYTVPYDDVVSVELMECTDLGRCISGQRTKDSIYGTWENKLWGSYQICADPRLDRHIVFKMTNGTFVLNYESNETTAALYRSILDLIPPN